ncbi:uncharacterized protein EDB93DRAFT_635831 [Suillus bovinus]|uniref:uncharacterized protein n=1 Tax=Suillus bovinus TaxID=48563 RepID=UPI001B877AE0|nr:uncharacterized protein EDB93DRAFT_635831 [Suillus bovinus]KAG2141440.1 hypothetical protein EDB93DRAFT_635831 [Suillus bovinus]
MRLLLFCVFLYLVGVIRVQAASPTNTTTSTSSNVSESPSFTNRTLWNIVSSSLLTLFACIYSAIHPNIPSPKDSPVLILWRRLGMMTMALIAPELIVTWAMRQWISARRVTKLFKESGHFDIPQPQEQPGDHGSVEAATAEQYVEDRDNTRFLISYPEGDSSSVLVATVPPEVNITTPAPNPNYGGTHALTKPFRKLFKAYVSEQSEDLDYTWTQTHSFFVLMGGFMLHVDEKSYHTLQPDEILELICKGCIDVPTLTANQIHDKSKGNAISKGLIILQVAWFVMQLVTRAIYRLETTQLEVGTLAFAVLNFLTYAVWWDKPLNVQCPHPMYWKSTESTPKDHIDDVHTENELTWFVRMLHPVFAPIIELIGAHDIPTSRKLRVPTFDGSIKFGDSERAVLQLSGLIMATIFGGIHCIAWFFAFPTHQEQVLWRIGGIVITCIPWFGEFVGFIIGTTELHAFRSFVVCLALVSPVVYIIGRAIVLVLMFTTLRNLPPDAYKAVLWTALVPHL